MFHSSRLLSRAFPFIKNIFVQNRWKGLFSCSRNLRTSLKEFSDLSRAKTNIRFHSSLTTSCVLESQRIAVNRAGRFFCRCFLIRLVNFELVKKQIVGNLLYFYFFTVEITNDSQILYLAINAVGREEAKWFNQPTSLSHAWMESKVTGNGFPLYAHLEIPADLDFCFWTFFRYQVKIPWLNIIPGMGFGFLKHSSSIC